MKLTNWDVVIVDDEPDSIGVLETILSFNEAHVRTASSGAEGLKLIREKLPTLVLLDIQMPQMSGWDVLEAIRGDEQLKKLVVIAVSAHAMLSDKEQMIAKGFNGYLSKPISAFTFLSDITAIMERLTIPA